MLNLTGNTFVVAVNTELGEIYVPRLDERDIAEFCAEQLPDIIFFFGTYGIAEV